MNCSEANPSPGASPRARDQTTADSESCQLATTSADSKTSADSETFADSKITTDWETIINCETYPPAASSNHLSPILPEVLDRH